MGPVTLYSYFRSSASFRVRIALHLKNIEFKYEPVHLLKEGGQQRKPAYLKLNPIGQVPTLVHEGKSIGQSVAIIEYLDEIFPVPRLFPKDAWMKARTRQICEIINSGIQPLHNLKVLQELERRYKIHDDEKANWSLFWIEKGLSAIENVLQETAGSYCIGDQVSAADVFLIPQIFGAQRYNFDINKYPRVGTIFQRCMSLEAFKNAQPSAQPDAE